MAMTKLGVVYTPPDVAGPMVELALAPLLIDKTPDQILALRIYDPAVGEGAFLIEVVRVLTAAVGSSFQRHIAAHCVRGTDIDPVAVAAARRAVERCVGAHVPELQHHLRVGDALAVDRTPHAFSPRPAGCIRRRELGIVPRRGFPGVIADSDAQVISSAHCHGLPPLQGLPRVARGIGSAVTLGNPRRGTQHGAGGIEHTPHYDAMVGNPPYIRQERIGTAKRQLRGFASYHGVADLYVYFLELAHRVVRPGGRYCLIVPNKWMTAGYGQPLREFLARASSVERIVDFGGGVFPDADAFPCIVAGTVGGTRDRPIVANRVAAVPVAEALAQPGVPHDRTRWGAKPWHIDGQADSAIAASIAANWPLLGDVVGAPSRGLVTGCNRAFVIDRAMRDALGDTSLVRPFLKGRDIRRWRPAAGDRYVIAVDHGVVPPPLVLAHLARFRAALEPGAGRKPGKYKWYELQDPIVPLAVSSRPRLFYQDIQTQPACCFDADGVFAPDTTVWVLPTDDRFVLAVLNSRLYGWYSRRRFPPALGGAVRPKRAYMTAFPLAVPHADLRTQVTHLVTAQLVEPTRVRDDAIDELVYEAYGLTRRQRAVVHSSLAAR